MAKDIIKPLLISLVAFTVAAPSGGVNGETEHSKVHCVNSAEGTCVVPLLALYAGALDAYQGQVVSTVGYLRTLEKKHLLFPDRTLGGFAPKEAAIVLMDRDDRFAEAFELENEQYVRVSGRIHAVSEDNVEHWAELDVASPPQRQGMTIEGPLEPPPKPAK